MASSRRIVVFLLLLSLLGVYSTTVIPDGSQCPGGWTRFEEKCYRLETTVIDFHEAQYACTLLGGYLAVPDNDRENAFLTGMLRTNNGQKAYLGVTNMITKRDFRDVKTNALASFIKWDKNEPNNFKNNEHCVCLLKNGYWNDIACNAVRWSICEQSIPTTQLPTTICTNAIPSTQPPTTTIACVGRADVVFMLDASGSVGDNNFQLMLSFVTNVIRDWDVDQDRFRVGVMTFASTPVTEFHLNTFNDKNQMLDDIANIKYTEGGTKTGVALEHLKDTMFNSNNGDRPAVPNIGIIITDGESNTPANTKAQGSAARNAGITLFSVGVGDSVDTAELEEMATDPATSHVFTVDDFSKLVQIKSVIQQETCEGAKTAIPTTQPPTTTPVCVGQADVVFMLDSSGSVGPSSFQLLLSFVSNVTSDWDVDQGRFRVGVMTFANTPVTEFHLNTFNDKNQMLDDIVNIQYKTGSTKTSVALEYLKDTMFNSNNGDRPAVPNIAIIITDGRSDSPANTKVQATAARNAGITLFSVGVGSGVKTAELNEIATDPDSSHVFTVDDFSKLAQIKSTIQQQTCGGAGAI